jgi:hypothetical protein
MEQDVFLSHASKDKQGYVEPLASALKQREVTFWLDSDEIGWGDNVTTKINEGLRNSRYAVVCLSANFLERPWPENELSAVLALQNTDGRKRVLPLILNSKEQVLQHYPLIAGLAFREFSAGPLVLADELASLVRPGAPPPGSWRVTLESAHTGIQSYLNVSPKSSVEWLRAMATRSLGLREEVDVGAPLRLRLRWVLVDVNAEAGWNKLSRAAQHSAYAAVRGEPGIRLCKDSGQTLEELGVEDGMVFHLVALQEEQPRRGGGGGGRGLKYR